MNEDVNVTHCCKVCNQPATHHVHVREIGDDQSKTANHYCNLHVPEFSEPQVTEYGSVTRDVATKLRWLIGLIETEHRNPTTDELRQVGIAGELNSDNSQLPFSKCQLSYLRTFAEFLEKHGCLPEDGELPPDPF